MNSSQPSPFTFVCVWSWNTSSAFAVTISAFIHLIVFDVAGLPSASLSGLARRVDPHIYADSLGQTVTFIVSDIAILLLSRMTLSAHTTVRGTEKNRIR